MTAENNRRSWMSVLAKAPAGRLLALWHELGAEPDFHWLRAPEIGATMVRGRLGGTGAPFNLGEMTLTRCALQLESGAVGHGYVQGRDKDKARVAALVDALMQTEQAEAVRATILTPLQAEMTAAKDTRAAKAAATKVDFFTMVRGED
ncbi:Alpha-D-ribose 1-methylphosphonate 5-triphosphate synthase subunit PhnG [Shimia sp. SK013]|uniref:phosphonate C-P lyase system protein PhnG n=1 Tax=Shimia sp. SK013 TaxID=1389006 RepID=UPI0006B4B36C|nr:phosphonate C-P lyase system protein PhnG [Shimia sp. SK013]KPA20607.1 Alpha-D-ribose 1-methylphosphonate 5-triphosphate synthase subunit PhnG [Shimia sp. SK013]